MKILNRAKSIYSDEYLISEDIKFELGLMYLRINGKWKECDKDTRSINFEDMLDSQGNKIFASLDRYYLKGADILENDSFLEDYSIQVAIYSEGCFYAQDKDGDMYNLCENWEKLKVIGIQE